MKRKRTHSTQSASKQYVSNTFYIEQQIKKELTPIITQQLRNELTPMITQQLRNELIPIITQQLRNELMNQVQEEQKHIEYSYYS